MSLHLTLSLVPPVNPVPIPWLTLPVRIVTPETGWGVGIVVPRLNAPGQVGSPSLSLGLGVRSRVGLTVREPAGSIGLNVDREERFGLSGSPECPVHRGRVAAGVSRSMEIEEVWISMVASRRSW